MGDPKGACRLPEIRVLGPIDVLADGPVDPSHRRRLTELGIFLALTPTCPTTGRVEEAVWPGRHPAPATRHSALSRLRGWWGVDEHGDPYVARHELRVRARSDWGRMCELTGYAGGIATLTTVPTPRLVEALTLVRGAPFGSVQWRALDWSDRLRIDMEYLIDQIATEVLDRAPAGSGLARLAVSARSTAMPWAS